MVLSFVSPAAEGHGILISFLPGKLHPSRTPGAGWTERTHRWRCSSERPALSESAGPAKSWRPGIASGGASLLPVPSPLLGALPGGILSTICNYHSCCPAPCPLRGVPSPPLRRPSALSSCSQPLVWLCPGLGTLNRAPRGHWAMSGDTVAVMMREADVEARDIPQRPAEHRMGFTAKCPPAWVEDPCWRAYQTRSPIRAAS